jgi:outer membrane protein
MQISTFRTIFCSTAATMALGLVFATTPAGADEPAHPEFPVVVPAPAAPPPPAPIAEEPVAEDDMHWQVAAGVGYRPDYEGSDHYDPHPFGSVALRWNDGRSLELRSSQSSGAAVRLSSQLIPHSWLKLGPVVQYRLKRADVQSGRVDAMDNIDGAVEVGGYLGVGEGPWSVGGTYTYDATGDYGGHLVELAAGWRDRLSDYVDMGLTVASTWAGEDYMETYFGVSADDAADSGLDAYVPDDSFEDGFKDVGARLNVGFGDPSWGGWKIIATTAYFRLIGEAADSPVVDDAGDENQFFGGIGIAYGN